MHHLYVSLNKYALPIVKYNNYICRCCCHSVYTYVLKQIPNTKNKHIIIIKTAVHLKTYIMYLPTTPHIEWRTNQNWNEPDKLCFTLLHLQAPNGIKTTSLFCSTTWHHQKTKLKITEIIYTHQQMHIIKL